MRISFYVIIKEQNVGRPELADCSGKNEVLFVVSFYDSVNDSNLKRVERLLEKCGIVYTLRAIKGDTALKEIQVAEEDLADAERILGSFNYSDNYTKSSNSTS
jgi:hypothetical protein